jgi:hypothetical protein
VIESTKVVKMGALAAAVVAIAGLTFWGVPFYIKTQVVAEVRTELAQAGVDALNDQADGNSAIGTAIITRLDSIEKRMIERDAMFIAYLERQAELAAARGN